MISALRAAVKTILENPFGGREWSVQGFGMLRTYLDADKVYRLNIWDSTLAVPDVSTIHDHPWDFTSWIISGTFLNYRYLNDGTECVDKTAKLYDCMKIQTGPGGGPREGAKQVWLRQCPVERYSGGDTYYQRAEEVHESVYLNGTVTLNERHRRPDGEHALVFWPSGRPWVDAEPREATEQEVADTIQRALEKWQ